MYVLNIVGLFCYCPINYSKPNLNDHLSVAHSITVDADFDADFVADFCENQKILTYSRYTFDLNYLVNVDYFGVLVEDVLLLVVVVVIVDE